MGPSTGMGAVEAYVPGSLALQENSALTTQQIPGTPLFSIELRLKAAKDDPDFTPSEQASLKEGQKALQDACQDIIPDDLEAQIETLHRAQLLVQSAQVFGSEVYGRRYEQLTKSLGIYTMRMRLAQALLDTDLSPEIESVVQLDQAPLSYVEINTLLPVIGRMMSSGSVRRYTEERAGVNGMIGWLEAKLETIRTRNVQDGHFTKIEATELRFMEIVEWLFSSMRETNIRRDQIIQHWKDVVDPEAAPILTALYEFLEVSVGLSPEATETFLFPAEGEQAQTLGSLMDSLSLVELAVQLQDTFDISIDEDEETGWSKWTAADVIAYVKPLIAQDTSTE